MRRGGDRAGNREPETHIIAKQGGSVIPLPSVTRYSRHEGIEIRELSGRGGVTTRARAECPDS